MLPDIEIILEDINRGYDYYSNLIHINILYKQMGIDKCECEDNPMCLLFILKSLEWRLEQELEDIITEKLYKQLIMIIGSSQIPEEPDPPYNGIVNNSNHTFTFTKSGYFIPNPPTNGIVNNDNHTFTFQKSA